MSPQEITTDLVKRYPPLDAVAPSILGVIEAMVRSYKNGGKLLTCGNGGSASDAEHIVGELLKGFRSHRRIKADFRSAFEKLFPADAELFCQNLQTPLPAFALTSHLALTTAYGNDVNPQFAFAQQVLGMGKKGDVLLGISTSGNSNNVIYAVKVAKVLGITTVALTGRTGGKLAGLCDHAIKAPADKVYLIQEYHLPIYHALCFAMEEEFFPGEYRDA